MINASKPSSYPTDVLLLSHLLCGKNKEEKAQKILNDFSGLTGLAQHDYQTLAQHPYLSTSTARKISSALTLGQRSLFPTTDYPSIRSPQEAYQVLWPHLQAKAEESLFALLLNRRRQLIQLKHLSQGSEAYTIVDPRQIFHYAIQARASGIILAHNHPSGDATPSKQDISITERVYEIGALLHIQLLDHLIIGNQSFVSFASIGLLPQSSKAFCIPFS